MRKGCVTKISFGYKEYKVSLHKATVWPLKCSS